MLVPARLSPQIATLEVIVKLDVWLPYRIVPVLMVNVIAGVEPATVEVGVHENEVIDGIDVYYTGKII